METSTPQSLGRKPRVLSIASPSYAGDDFVSRFQSTCDLHIILPSDRNGTVQAISDARKSDGSFDAVLIGMGNGGYERFDEGLLGPLLPELKIVASVNAGYSEFDMEWFNKNKIVVTNTVDAVAEPTADIAIFLMLGALRDTSRLEAEIRNGGWRGGSKLPLLDPKGRTLGIIGMGKIGKHVARKSQVFGMDVQYYNRTRLSPEDESRLSVEYAVSLEALLKTSDVVSINCPLTPETRGLIGSEEFAKMKDGVILVNTGRGAVVDEAAFIEALESGKVARAGLDVFDGEPNVK
ncbi:putative 2-hydroxyacid dehydrogenase [Colletotrichum siamense]|uniref:2-hydroxyacid dehydrogenase n=1 Tax=Colletotrichum siamense TaxID=690259 RepID=A0A9P5K4Z8_COLSI|nr:putative 2-hydroxyacid dehydrogenase [Colletotrichum siamense]KAF4859354.1 putative 2-hydroxyacid dehydrogenase [Colletotrichum siamense]